MSSDNTTIPQPPGEEAPIPQMPPILTQGLANLQAHNARANSELSDILGNMRSQLGYGQFSGATADTADAQYQKLLLHTSQWNSEVVMAAVLNAEFREQIGKRAHEILVDAGVILPPP